MRDCKLRAEAKARTSMTPKTFGPYQIQRVLGSGSFATVYLGWDPRLQRSVAVKMLFPHYANNSEQSRRFLDEGRALAKVRHSNIVQIYDVGELKGQPYYVMEYLDGMGLDEVIQSN